ncbi:MAG TPA: ATP-dependent DNA ligase [Acidimicrobiia bacterium]|nr:ATP-dependent DNA ligase [Acidimicrobiia bacterium]
MLLAEVVAVSAQVKAVPARSAKIAALAGLLRRLEPAEVEPAVGFLVGEPRQGRIGVGWATIAGRLPAHRASGPAPDGSVDPITVGEVDRTLTALAGTTGSGSVEARAVLLDSLLGRASRAEADFLADLLTGGLRQGALEGVMAEAVAQAAGVPAALVRRAGMLAGDLGHAATVALTADRAGLEAVGLEVLRPVGPMLASTAQDVAEAIAGLGLSSVEWKLDGIRLQVHKRGGEVRIFTRNLNDITARMPEVVAVIAGLPAESLVLDGEALTLTEDLRPRPFQETMSRMGRHRSGPPEALALRAGAHFFDCLHVDGEDLLDRPLLERQAALERVAGPYRIPGEVTDDPAAAGEVLRAALAAGHEGVVVKGAGSTYEAGRRGKSWRKVKVARTFDLVVLGAEWGHGRRQGWLSNLHLGARDPATGDFVMVGKTFKGMTQKTLEWQTERFLELETYREGITVFIRPEVVAEIALDGVQVSKRYPGGVALRFARLKGYRDDKSPADADTVDDLRSLIGRSDIAPGAPHRGAQ